jgi:hypothetical protein
MDQSSTFAAASFWPFRLWLQNPSRADSGSVGDLANPLSGDSKLSTRLFEVVKLKVASDYVIGVDFAQLDASLDLHFYLRQTVQIAPKPAASVKPAPYFVPRRTVASQRTSLPLPVREQPRQCESTTVGGRHATHFLLERREGRGSNLRSLRDLPLPSLAQLEQEPGLRHIRASESEFSER